MVCQVPEAVTERLRTEFLDYMKTRPDLGPADFAQYTTLAETTVRSWLRGDIPGGFEVQAEMRRVLDQARAGDVLTPGGSQSVMVTESVTKRVRSVAKAGTFYTTQTVKRIGEVLDYCAENCAIGVITASFGVGKTEAVKAWRRRNAGKVESVVFEFDEFSSTNKVDFVRVMARQFGLANDVGSQNGGLVFRDLCEYLRRNPCLIVLDQCETLRPRICQIIRQIWDRTNDAGVGVVMLAAPILLARLISGKMLDLEALSSRVGVWAPLSGLTKAEMAAIVKQEGFDDVDELAFDLWFKACAGSMRRLMRSMDLLKARHSGKHIGEKTIAGVAAHLWGMNAGGGA
ncbi:MAG: ATP-binding protein [Candidatus Sulfopaludibacter sp.]|nr:ATP-binding protein [Candidatus Sulfopaludibacter sp.]